MALPTNLQTGLQFLTKDFLRFWMVDIRGRVAAKLKAHASNRQAETEAGAPEGRRRAAPRESAPVKLLAA